MIVSACVVPLRQADGWALPLGRVGRQVHGADLDDVLAVVALAQGEHVSSRDLLAVPRSARRGAISPDRVAGVVRQARLEARADEPREGEADAEEEGHHDRWNVERFHNEDEYLMVWYWIWGWFGVLDHCNVELLSGHEKGSSHWGSYSPGSRGMNGS